MLKRKTKDVLNNLINDRLKQLKYHTPELRPEHYAEIKKIMKI